MSEGNRLTVIAEPNEEPGTCHPTQVAATAVRTLIGNGYRLASANQQANDLLLHCRRTDGFGISVAYMIVLADGVLSQATTSAIARLASRDRAHLVVIGDVRDPA